MTNRYSEVAGRCHWCGVVGKPAEVWAASDTCDQCAYLMATSRYGNTGQQRRLAKEELKHWGSANRRPTDPRHPWSTKGTPNEH